MCYNYDKMYLTVDDKILLPYQKGMMLDTYGNSFVSEKLDHVGHLAKEMKGFTLHLPNSRSTSYFIKTYSPYFPEYQVPTFSLKVIEGDPKVKETWELVVDLGFCYVNLLDVVLVKNWHNRYISPKQDELFYYDIPIGI